MKHPKWTEMGHYYGYPECCIRSFVRGAESERNPVQLKASNGSGFVPCVKHSKEVVAGKIKLRDLILPTRKAPKPFREE